MDNKMILPQVINMFNVYKSGERQIGIANEVSLAEVAYKTVTIDGAGIPGSYEETVIGNFDSIKQTIPFSNLYADMIDFTNPMEVQDIIMRGSMQVTNSGTGSTIIREYVSRLKENARTSIQASLSKGKDECNRNH